MTKDEAIRNLLEVIVTEEISHEAEVLAEIIWYDDEAEGLDSSP
jgi:Mn-containing catalase